MKFLVEITPDSKSCVSDDKTLDKPSNAFKTMMKAASENVTPPLKPTDAVRFTGREIKFLY